MLIHLVFIRGEDGHDGEALDIYHGLGEAMGANEQLHPCSCARAAREVDEEGWEYETKTEIDDYNDEIYNQDLSYGITRLQYLCGVRRLDDVIYNVIYSPLNTSQFDMHVVA